MMISWWEPIKMNSDMSQILKQWFSMKENQKNLRWIVGKWGKAQFKVYSKIFTPRSQRYSISLESKWSNVTYVFKQIS